MKIMEDIRSVTYLKTKAADLLDQVNETRRPVIVTQNGEPKAVLIDPASFEELKENVYLSLMIKQSQEDIKAGRVVSEKDVFKHMDQFIDEKLNQKKI